MRSLDDAIILITGATDGLGRHVARDLARGGGTILLHGRNQAKGKAALEEIRRETRNERLHYYNADLSSLGEVRRLADEVAADHPRLDVLINNAGIGAGPAGGQLRQTSADGFELRFAVNYLSHYLLTRRLLPLLRRGAAEGGEARIVNVSSGAQHPLHFDDLPLERSYDGMRAYSQSKLAQILFTFDLAEELRGKGITANALHPASLMDTQMVREWFGRPRTTVDEGAKGVEWLALSADLEGITGEYFEEMRPARANAQAYDPEARRRLRELSERWTAPFVEPD